MTPERVESKPSARWMSRLAGANATLAVLSALLGAAPFTPAVLLFVVHAPLAALFAFKGHARSGLVAVVAGVAAWGLTPLRLGDAVPPPLLWLLGWSAVWLVVAAVLSFRSVARRSVSRLS